MQFSASPLDKSDALIDWRVPQIEALKQAITAADRGEFANPQEAEAFFKPRGA